MGKDDHSDYMKLLAQKMQATERWSPFVAHEVADLVGMEAVRLSLVNLWPVACQTCGEPLGIRADVSAYRQGPDKVRLTLHHPACRPSSVFTERRLAIRPPTCAFALASVNADGGPGGFPAMIVNPSCEHLTLSRSDGQWRIATLDEFTDLGFVAGSKAAPPLIRDVSADLTGKRLTVTAPSKELQADHTWSIPEAPDEVVEAVPRLKGLAVAVITKALPNVLDLQQLCAALVDPDARVGWVQLTRRQ